MKLELTQYDPAGFRSLNEFEDSKRLLLKHTDAIEALGEVIRDFNLEDLIGICLLHKHFEITDCEILIEKITDESSFIAPHPRDAAATAIPYMWRLLMGEDGNIRWIPLEFVDLNSVAEEEVAAVDCLCRAEDFFNAFSQKLLTLGAANVFGISLHHRSKLNFDRTEQVLLENDSFTERYMSIRPVPRAEASEPSWTQTLWRFPKIGSASVEATCDGHGCAGHCSGHSHTPT